MLTALYSQVAGHTFLALQSSLRQQELPLLVLQQEPAPQALEALGVEPLLLEDDALGDGLLADRAGVEEVFVVALGTDRPPLDTVGPLAQPSPALPTLETLAVEILAGELQARPEDDLSAVRTFLTKDLHIAGLAVVLALLLPVDGVQQRAAVVTLETTSVKLLPVHDKFGV